jgi:hypothetical protein
LIDVKSRKVIAEGTCWSTPPDSPAPASRRAPKRAIRQGKHARNGLKTTDPAVLRSMVESTAELCKEDFRTRVLGLN